MLRLDVSLNVYVVGTRIITVIHTHTVNTITISVKNNRFILIYIGMFYTALQVVERLNVNSDI